MGIQTSQYASPMRRAERCGGKGVAKQHTLARDAVDRWRLDERMPHAPQLVPPQIVDQHKDDIRPLRRLIAGPRMNTSRHNGHGDQNRHGPGLIAHARAPLVCDCLLADKINALPAAHQSQARGADILVCHESIDRNIRPTRQPSPASRRSFHFITTPPDTTVQRVCAKLLRNHKPLPPRHLFRNSTVIELVATKLRHIYGMFFDASGLVRLVSTDAC
jgi:hypothetical protein